VEPKNAVKLVAVQAVDCVVKSALGRNSLAGWQRIIDPMRPTLLLKRVKDTALIPRWHPEVLDDEPVKAQCARGVVPNGALVLKGCLSSHPSAQATWSSVVGLREAGLSI
jgi:hypothetical protein